MNSPSLLRLKKSLSSLSLRFLAHTNPSSQSKVQEDKPVGSETCSQMAKEEEPASVPAFLKQERSQLLEKFHDLTWSQWLRTRQAETNNDPNSQWALDTSEEVAVRNRYFNIQPWANNRIRLKVPDGQVDYINASPVSVKSSVTGQETRFIATQGPIDTQINQFWRMALEETSSPSVIIMLTQLVELGKIKCARYFPEGKDDVLEITDEGFGDGFSATIAVEEIEEIETAQAIVRKLAITIGEEKRTFWHLLFVGWPDFQVPEDEGKDALLKFIKLTEDKNSVSGNPRIIHCSAGVGRSGTFIALEHLLQELDDGAFNKLASSDGPVKHEDDPIFGAVDALRQQRMFMVQSEAQYVFLYKILLDAWMKKQSTPA